MINWSYYNYDRDTNEFNDHDPNSHFVEALQVITENSDLQIRFNFGGSLIQYVNLVLMHWDNPKISDPSPILPYNVWRAVSVIGAVGKFFQRC